MFHYIVRIELHHATADDYQKLHAIMLKANFGNLIKGGDGKLYRLPTAEYHAQETTQHTAIKMRDFVSELIKPIGRTFWILATRADDIAWFSDVSK